MAISDEIQTVLTAKAAALVGRKAEDLGALMHNEFVYINASGMTFDKAGYIETYCTSGQVVFTQQRFADLSVKLIDDFAVATFSISDELRINGRAVSGRYRSLCIFGRSSGDWLWAAGQTMAAGPK